MKVTPEMSRASRSYQSMPRLIDKISKKLEEKLALWIELITFCGLSGRTFFSGSQDYCNRDNFQLKRFSNSVAYKTITRRRDGCNENIISKHKFREVMPSHVRHLRTRLNEDFLHSLISAQSRLNKWESIFQGIISFNLSNSDGPYTSEAIELVFSVSAFERLLKSNSQKRSKGSADEDLANRFTQLLGTQSDMDIIDCYRGQQWQQRQQRQQDKKQKLQKDTSIQEVWMRDIVIKRGSLAHGHSHESYASIWTLKEHLLLSSFIFPLALKHYLSNRNIYEKSYYDHTCIDFFPKILCHEKTSDWDVVWREFRWDQIRKQRSAKDTKHE
ncbi:hypothetical protein [Leptolyngbya sp. CCY15150]|uniref:hypothetical protein n=1 Tax=Leptolyngbya sp. CCY15150 TaxID=2767772 RepID=UPI001951D4B7|nr:hypothetical protein [Leptolyngbya sp. CCY15150]